MKKAKTDRDRLIGGLGGAGGALLFTVLFEYLSNPSWRESNWLLYLSFVIIGTSLVLAAVFLSLKDQDQVVPSVRN
jgi:multisubunit Na+/H+ antiporter MnhB subunit